MKLTHKSIGFGSLFFQIPAKARSKNYLLRRQSSARSLRISARKNKNAQPKFFLNNNYFLFFFCLNIEGKRRKSRSETAENAGEPRTSRIFRFAEKGEGFDTKGGAERRVKVVWSDTKGDPDFSKGGPL